MAYQAYPPYQQQPPQQGGTGPYYPPPPGQIHGHIPPGPPHDPFRAYYADRLRQLTFNSRPIIQDLSMMAGAQRDQNNWEGMNTVVQEIEEATLRALPTQKLPLLYLIDSISKNIGPPYTTHLLPPIIPRLYLRTYREVDGVTKAKMEEMINLWRSGGPGRTELYPGGVREQIERDIFGSSFNTPSNVIGSGLPSPAFPTLQQVKQTVQNALDKKQREAASKAWDLPTGQQVNALTGILNLLNSTNVSPQELAQIMDQVKSIGSTSQPPPGPPLRQPQQPVFSPQPPLSNLGTPNWNQPAPAAMVPNSLPPFPPSHANIRQPTPQQIPVTGRPTFVPTPPQASLSTPIPGSTTPIPAPALPIPALASLPIDVSKILNSLNKSGVVSQNRTPEPESQAQASVQIEGERSPLEAYEDAIINKNITLRNIDLNSPNKLSLEHLPHRCKQCGMRFASDGPHFQAHMDWHFRRNRKERESAGRGAHRRWLPRSEEWIKDTYSSNAEAGPSNPSTNLTNSPGKTASGGTISAERLNQLRAKWVKVPQDTKKAASVCPVCKEAFVKEWSEDEEEWIWKNALNINGTYYHATCRAEQLSAMRRLKGSDPNKRSTSGSPRLTTTPQPPDLTQSASAASASVQVKNETLEVPSVSGSGSPQSQKRKADEESADNGEKAEEGLEAKRVKVESGSEPQDSTVNDVGDNGVGASGSAETGAEDPSIPKIKEETMGEQPVADDQASSAVLDPEAQSETILSDEQAQASAVSGVKAEEEEAV
ncbi:uncharacterized protein I303_104464 [Kwoniella dejecticola CBS 10117]|uniref:CID domain-containing protein n=1 Tax=Kwoniella dejecticola CBS 10117 TaxID=1296121 RepID=A0A1A6A582_9TREE|nr:uncharacterized protein I303_04558 [Kwoniella dejecticola CBS 10117]OBR85225.1 hypothetical protein I303_04558 [Kwoniella dejecticola CBS 10117]